MSEKIRQFYENNNAPKYIIEKNLKLFDKHKDIAAEFEFWIDHREFITDSPVCVEGYTAKNLSDLSNYLNGDGAFLILVELRDDPKKAHTRIDRGFARK